MATTSSVTTPGAFLIGQTPVARGYSVIMERADSSILHQVQGYRFCDAAPCGHHVNAWRSLSDDCWYYNSDVVLMVVECVPQNFCSTKCAAKFLRKQATRG
jgi:hypothetical protein